MFQDRYQEKMKTQNLGSLRDDLVHLIGACGLELDPQAHDAITAIWGCQFGRRKLREIVKQSMLSVPGIHRDWGKIERRVLSRKNIIFNPPKPNLLTKPGEPPPPPPTLVDLLRASKPPIFLETWDIATTTSFLALVLKWRKAVDLRDKLISLVALTCPDTECDSRLRAAAMVERVVERHRLREKHQAALESEQWSKPKLIQALEVLVNQEGHSWMSSFW